MVADIIESKGSVAGFASPLGNPAAQPLGAHGILRGLGLGEARGTRGVGVKSCNPSGTTGGEGVSPEQVRR